MPTALFASLIIAAGSPFVIAADKPGTPASPAPAPAVTPDPSPDEVKAAERELAAKKAKEAEEEWKKAALDRGIELLFVQKTAALDILGTPDTKVIQPSSLRSMVVDLGSFLNKDSQLVPSVAIEVTPLQLGAGNILNIDWYRKYPISALSWTSMSIATAPRKTDGVNTAFAIKVPFFDANDPYMNPGIYDAVEAVKQDKSLEPISMTAPPGKKVSQAQIDAALAREDARLKAIDKAVADRTHWNNWHAHFGLGRSFQADDKAPSSSKPSSSSEWLTLGAPLLWSNNWQLVSSLRHANFLNTLDALIDSGVTRDVYSLGFQANHKSSDVRIGMDTGFGYIFQPGKYKWVGGLTAQYNVPVYGWVEGSVLLESYGLNPFDGEKRVISSFNKKFDFNLKPEVKE